MNQLAKIQKAVENAGLDAILITCGINRFYATGFKSSAGAVIITPKEGFFFTDSRYMEAACANTRGFTLGLVTREMSQNTWIAQTIRDCGIKTMGIEQEVMTLGDFRRLEEKHPETNFTDAQGVLSTLRQSKDRPEADSIRAAQEIAEKALDEVLRIIVPGMTENDVSAELQYRMLRLGSEGNSFDPIVVSGARSSMPHGVPGDNVIKRGDFITMDFGCVKNGYCGDMTRTVAVGEASDEMKNVYGVVLEAQLAGIEAARPGALGRDIDAAARGVISDAGYGDYFGHGFGHGLGLEVHEGYSVSPMGDKEMAEGAVISAEPGIYLVGKFGVRIEDLLYLTGDGCENLNKSPKNLIIL